jgi:tRNA threonylcarbamoyladenosine biosynthesis protein TsaB
MSIRILAIDATTEYGSLALVEDELIVDETAMQSRDGFGHIMFGLLDGMLQRQQWSIDSIDSFAVAFGPGSFTGVRVGLAAVKGFAMATNKTVVCVSNLRAVAWFGTGTVRAAMIDAHREEIYAGVFDDKLQLLGEELVTKPAAWLPGLPEGAELISADAEMLAKHAPHITLAPRVLAGAIGVIATKDFRAGKAIEAAAAEANYVRRSDAEMFTISYRPLRQST